MYARSCAVLILEFIFITILFGCAVEPYTREEFRFPIINGNIAQGQAGFVALGCNRCHTVSGVDLPAYQGNAPLSLELGGKIIFVKTYGELVTSIINPDHVISKKYIDSLDSTNRKQITSPMPFNREMTIEQLVDVVTFLNSRYVLLEPGYQPGFYLSESDYR